ncbi:MAG: D-amino-acid oxidase [Caulobacteraceae bacterium]|nr:D-amino-acid oxidase [Caulobacteraceae bacterium]
MTSRLNSVIDRRRLLQGTASVGGLSLFGLAGCATGSGRPRYDAIVPPLAPVRAHADRLFDITVCLRPFRAAGPRLDTEQVGDTLVVHNYGHGGSGWSLSWGSSTIAVGKAMASSPREVAVIGCGALGLTSAILAQRAGAKVTIYARDLLPQARSARATGSWTPSSRICLESVAGPGFATLWEQMARTSHKTYRNYLGLPGKPVEWTDRYNVSDISREEQRARRTPDPLGFAEYDHLIADLNPAPQLLPRGGTPFDAPFVYRSESMMFNIADYGHTLMTDFFAAGGEFRRTEFHTPAELGLLKEKVVINCPGYAARALWRDESIVPVRGQIAWLIPQGEVNYGVTYKNVSVLSRTDGIVVQAVEGGDMKGYKDDNETVDRAEADKAVATVAELYSRFRRG